MAKIHARYSCMAQVVCWTRLCLNGIATAKTTAIISCCRLSGSENNPRPFCELQKNRLSQFLHTYAQSVELHQKRSYWHKLLIFDREWPRSSAAPWWTSSATR